MINPLVIGFGACCLGLGSVACATPFLPFTPDIHKDQVVFSAEGDLWLGSTKGGKAYRLTSWPGVESYPRFSPDGKRIAFTGGIDGRTDIYVIPVAGGQPVRYTFDNRGATLVDWLADGQLLFASARYSAHSQSRLFTLPDEPGALPTPLPFLSAGYGAQVDAQRWVFTRKRPNGNNWRRYRGGEANDVFLWDKSKNTVQNLTQTDLTEEFPLVVNGQVYFIKEEPLMANLFRVPLQGGKPVAVTKGASEDTHAPATDGEKIVYVKGQNLYVFDPADERETKLGLQLVTDRVHAQPYRKVAELEQFFPGPSGKRALLASRGQITNAATAEGELRPVMAVAGIEAKLPTWSPNGKVVAWVSDESDDWNIWVQPADGSANRVQVSKVKGIDFTQLQWAPSSTYMLALDTAGRLLQVPFGSGDSKVIVEKPFAGVTDFAISADSRLVAYSFQENLFASSIEILDLQTGLTHVVSKRPFRSYSPAFDPASGWLYYLSDRNIGQRWDSVDFDMNAGPATQVMGVLISKNATNPFLLKSDEEAPTPEPEPHIQVVYNFEKMPERAILFPVTVGELQSLQAGSNRVLFLRGSELQQFELTSKKVSTLAEGARSFRITADRKRAAVQTGDGLSVLDISGGSLKPVPTAGWTVSIDPKKEWRQILRSAWRQIRDQFYDPKLHGADWEEEWKKAESQLEAVGHRSELTRIIEAMFSALNISHLFVQDGEVRFENERSVGGHATLGADLEWDWRGAYRITKLLSGDGFEFNQMSPLLAPGLDVEVGDFVFSIAGTKLTSNQDPEVALSGKTGQTIAVEVGKKSDGSDRRLIRVRPLSSESRMRYFDWTGSNRSKVEEKGEGKLAYIHVPAMGADGMIEFSKHFYPNLDKDGLIIDVRFNSGGITSGLILERLRRVIFEYDQGRYGAPIPYHRAGVRSHIVVLCNEHTASDGEYFCTGFKAMKLGTVIGNRTWGGYAAAGGIGLIDGGSVTHPFQGSFATNGDWLPDGTGFVPDIKVDPAILPGEDPQLEAAIKHLLKRIKDDPPASGARRVPPQKNIK